MDVNVAMFLFHLCCLLAEEGKGKDGSGPTFRWLHGRRGHQPRQSPRQWRRLVSRGTPWPAHSQFNEQVSVENRTAIARTAIEENENEHGEKEEKIEGERKTKDVECEDKKNKRMRR